MRVSFVAPHLANLGEVFFKFLDHLTSRGQRLLSGAALKQIYYLL